MLERLLVQIGADVSELEASLAGATRSMAAAGEKMQSVGKTLTAAVTLPLVGVGVASVKMASDAEEAANKFNVVMGPAANRLRKEFAKLHSTIPLTTHEMEGLSAGIQDMLVPAGIARDEAADMSLGFVKLAADLGSFNNVGTAEVLQDIGSALAGQSEPMRKYGVDVSVTRLKALALEKGIKLVNGELSNQQKALLIQEAVLRDSTDAIGDAANTAGSASNSFKFFARDAKELGATIGRILLPVVTPMVQKLSSALKLFEGLSPQTQRVIVVVGALAAATGPLLLALGTLVTVLPTIKVGLLAIKVAMVALTGPVGLVAAAVVGLGVVWLKWGDDIKRIVAATVQQVSAWFGRLTAPFDKVSAGVERVTGAFRTMWDKVVGHSYVPDMIAGVGSEFAKLGSVMVTPATASTAAVSGAFANLQTQVTASATTLTGVLTQTGLERFQAMQAQREEAARLRNEFLALGGTLDTVTVQSTGNIGTLGTSVGGLRGALGEAAAGFKAAGSSTLDYMKGVGVRLLGMMNPLTIVSSMLDEAFRSTAETMKPLMDAVGKVAASFGKALAPILRAMFPAFKLTAVIATYLGQVFAKAAQVVFNIASGLAKAIGAVIKGIGTAIDKIPGLGDFGMKKAGQGLINLGNSFKDTAREFGNVYTELGVAREEIKAITLDGSPASTQSATAAPAIAQGTTNGPVDQAQLEELRASVRVQQDGFMRLVRQQELMVSTLDDVRREVRRGAPLVA